MFQVQVNLGFSFQWCHVSDFRSFHLDWAVHLHQILQPGHGELQAGRAPGEPRRCGHVLRLVHGRSLGLLQPGGDHWPAAHAGCQNNSDEGTL